MMIDVATDASKNVYVARRIGNVAGDPPYSEWVAFRRVGLQKIDGYGTTTWVKQLSSNNVVAQTRIVADSNGNLLVSGYFCGQTAFDDGAVDSVAAVSGFVAKYEPGGLLSWRRTFTGTGTCQADGVDVGSDGSVAITGWFNGLIDFGGGAISSAGDDDAFVVRLDANGAYLWMRRFGDAAAQNGADVAVSANGECTVIGEFQGSIDLGGGTHTSVGSADIFLARLDANGNHEMSRVLGSPTYDVAYDLELDSHGAAIMMARVGGPSAPTMVTMFDEAYVERWSHEARPVGYATGNELAVGPSDGVYWLDGTNWTNIVLVNANADGEIVSASTIEDIAVWIPSAIAVDADGDVAVGFMIYNGEDDYGERYFVGLRSIAIAQPHISSVKDILDDQGGEATMRFERSRFDGTIPPAVVSYDVYMRDDRPPAVESNSPPPGNWIVVASLTADGRDEYQATVPTQGDRTPTGGAENTVYFVRALTADPAVYFDSETAEGFSLDNLAPLPPSNVTFDEPTLYWQGGDETDFVRFVVYGSPAPQFTPSTIQIAETSERSIEIAAPGHAYYLVTALDDADNESAPGIAAGNDATPPWPPANLHMTGTVLLWDAALEFDFDRHLVYGSPMTAFDANAVLIGTTTAPSFNTEAWPYPNYYVTTVDAANNESGAARAKDLMPPPTPAGVQFDGRVVTWNAVLDAGLTEYVVYGSMSGNFANAKTQLGTPTTTSFDVSGYPFAYFFVTARDWNDNESAPTRVADGVAPSGVLNVSYRSGLLTWEAPPEADISNYTVYGSEYDSFEQPNTTIQETLETSYYAADDGFPFHYITAIDRWGNEGPAVRAKTPPVTFTFAITAFPNPFNPATTIRYEVPRSGNARVGIYDAHGALVATLIDASHQAGSYDVEWRGTDAAGNPSGSGVYFARIEFGGDIKSRKLVLLK